MSHYEYHTPVMVRESMDLLDIKPDGIYMDGTLGGGGHFREIITRLDSRGIAIGVDRDPQAIEWNRTRLPQTQSKVVFEQSRYSQAFDVVKKNHLSGLDGILLDLGISSRQIDNSERGFAYLSDSPLDMRMNPADRTTAADILRIGDETELARILGEFGEVHNPGRMARAIIEWRNENTLENAADLKQCLAKEYGGDLSPKVLSKIFQALRIAVNKELDELGEFLEHSAQCLRSGGRLVIIAYHSLEDRMVKQFMKVQENPCTCPPRAPVCSCGKRPVFKRINHKAMQPSDEEISLNRRARSARLRGAQKV